MRKYLPKEYKNRWDILDDIRRHSLWLRVLYMRMDKYKDKLK